MNNKGVSLVELLVYIVLFSVVSLLIGSQMKQLLKSYNSGRQIIKLQSDSRDILAMMSREVRNTGLKTYLKSSGPGKYTTVVEQDAFLPVDSSSFVHKEGNPGDTLTIYKLSLNDFGDRTGVDNISYFLNGTSLMRLVNKKKMILAENIYALQFQYGVFALDSLLMDQKLVNPDEWSVPFSVGKSGTMRVTIPSSTSSGSIRCNKTFKINKAQRVLVSFTVSASGNFPDNLDSIKCCVKRSGYSNVLSSEKFLANGSEIKLIMPVPKTDNAIISFDFWCKGSGNLDIKSLEVRRADLGEFVWENNPSKLRKSAVKAIRIFALARGKGSAGVGSDQEIAIANIKIGASGQYLWRIMKETVEVLNNGSF